MTDHERQVLASAAIPLEVLYSQMLSKPYKEMTPEFHEELKTAVVKIRYLLGLGQYDE